MKKKHLRATWRMLASVVFFSTLLPVRAQVSNPSAWSDFVKGKGNPLVIDTFRTQTFQQLPVDNWTYTAEAGAGVPEGKKTLQVPVGGTVSFIPFSIDKYKDVAIRFRYAGDKLVKQENLQIRYLCNDKPETEILYSPVKVDDYFAYKYYQIENSPTSLEIHAAGPANNSLNGYYLFSSFSAFGTISQYSFFSGKGNWNDTICWSHLPPLRRRSALISGAVSVSSFVECRTASLGGGGSLNIAKNAHFTVDSLLLYSADFPLTTTDNPLTATYFSLTVEGELCVKEGITLQHTFPEKGKWYFLSFPFDVFLKGMDSRFQLKDNHFSGSGNYLYVQTYNGDKRTSSQKPTGNWEVFPMPASSGNPLIFEKGRGYLVALDAKASDNTLTFSTDKGSLPGGFGKTASIPIHIVSSGDAGRGHDGWYLCGNPLPAPLILSQLESNPVLDGNIYLYDGNCYKPYPLESNYALPPLATFFVKASATTELTITNEPPAANTVLLKSSLSLCSELTEPTVISTQTSLIRNNEGKSVVKGNALYLNDLPFAGKVQVMDIAGGMVYSHSVPGGSSVLSLPLRSGLYILIIDAGGYRAQHKCVLTQ